MGREHISDDVIKNILPKHKQRIKIILDHTFIEVYDENEKLIESFGCAGRNHLNDPSIAEKIYEGEGDLEQAKAIYRYPSLSTENLTDFFHYRKAVTDIVYLASGVCHQIANRVLSATNDPEALVTKARGYKFSYFLYGHYGKEQKSAEPEKFFRALPLNLLKSNYSNVNTPQTSSKSRVLESHELFGIQLDGEIIEIINNYFIELQKTIDSLISNLKKFADIYTIIHRLINQCIDAIYLLISIKKGKEIAKSTIAHFLDLEDYESSDYILLCLPPE